jgi:hypothetical protein
MNIDTEMLAVRGILGALPADFEGDAMGPRGKFHIAFLETPCPLVTEPGLGVCFCLCRADHPRCRSGWPDRRPGVNRGDGEYTAEFRFYEGGFCESCR